VQLPPVQSFWQAPGAQSKRHDPPSHVFWHAAPAGQWSSHEPAVHSVLHVAPGAQFTMQ
jgi:hypothetical protein